MWRAEWTSQADGVGVRRSLRLQRGETGCGFLWGLGGGAGAKAPRAGALHSLILLLASRRECSDFLINLLTCGAEEKRQSNTKKYSQTLFLSLPPFILPSFLPFLPVHVLLVESGLFHGTVRKAFCRPVHGRLWCSKVIPYS